MSGLHRQAAEQATLQGAALLGRRRLIGRCFLDWVTEAQLNRHRRRALVQQIWKVSNAVMQSSLQVSKWRLWASHPARFGSQGMLACNFNGKPNPCPLPLPLVLAGAFG